MATEHSSNKDCMHIVSRQIKPISSEIRNPVKQWQANTTIVSCKYLNSGSNILDWMACAADMFCQTIYYNWGSELVATEHFSR